MSNQPSTNNNTFFSVLASTAVSPQFPFFMYVIIHSGVHFLYSFTLKDYRVISLMDLSVKVIHLRIQSPHKYDLTSDGSNEGLFLIL